MLLAADLRAGDFTETKGQREEQLVGRSVWGGHLVDKLKIKDVCSVGRVLKLRRICNQNQHTTEKMNRENIEGLKGLLFVLLLTFTNGSSSSCPAFVQSFS